MNQIRINVVGIPRPYNGTDNRRGGGRYVPQRVRDWQEAVATAAKNAIQHSDWTCSAGRIRLVMEFYLPDYRTRDLDNLEKSTSDSLKEIAFNDDDQVIERMTAKRYLPEMPEGTPAGVSITIVELTPTHQTRQDYNAKRRKPKCPTD